MKSPTKRSFELRIIAAAVEYARIKRAEHPRPSKTLAPEGYEILRAVRAARRGGAL